MIDPARFHSYLQVACAALDFDIAEVWWTKDGSGSSTVAAIEDKRETALVRDEEQHRSIRFLQLYTSKQHSDLRSKLVTPEQDGNDDIIDDDGSTSLVRKDGTSNLEKHVLSPRLVDAISSTAKVLWTTSQKTEGLLGRSDVPLQTAVGMPVAVDENGNMCIVLMFSHHNVPSSDDAFDYLQFISQSATSNSIPGLFPVVSSSLHSPFVSGADLHLPLSEDEQSLSDRSEHPHVEEKASLGEGISAHFLSLGLSSSSSDPEGGHAPLRTDDDGMPILPAASEIPRVIQPSVDNASDPFDDATFGVWSTIVDFEGPRNDGLSIEECGFSRVGSIQPNMRRSLSTLRRGRLEEFAEAFIGMSIFDAADVWIPVGGGCSELCHVTSVCASTANAALKNFSRISEHTRIKMFSGAVGTAYGEGNVVWTSRKERIVDDARAAACAEAEIRTAFASPIFSKNDLTPSCVLCCYSHVRADPVGCIQKFVQQALRLLWNGLDQVEPHESVGKKLWKDVAPADLGEMAADVEMQHTFIAKKRPLVDISTCQQMATGFQPHTASSPPLATQPQETIPSEFSSNAQVQPLNCESNNTVMVPNSIDAIELHSYMHAQTATQDVQPAVPEDCRMLFPPNVLQKHMQDALQSVASAVPMTVHEDASRNDGTKRARMEIYPPAQAPSQSEDSNGNANTAPVNPTPIFPNNMSMQGVFPLSQPISTWEGNNLAVVTPAVSSNSLMLNTANTAATYMLPSDSVCLPVGTAVVLPRNRAAETNGKICKIEGCDEPAVLKRPYCLRHVGNRSCEHPGCTRCAQGPTRFCIGHGGGNRCRMPGCDRGARDKNFCAAHGGGKRCSVEGCPKAAVGGSDSCTNHGGGRRCTVTGCTKSAQGRLQLCVKHGGGRRCAHVDCTKVARGKTDYCAAHGGGVRCKLEGCNRITVGKDKLCRLHGGRAKAPSVQVARNVQNAVTF